MGLCIKSFGEGRGNLYREKDDSKKSRERGLKVDLDASRKKGSCCFPGDFVKKIGAQRGKRGASSNGRAPSGFSPRK